MDDVPPLGEPPAALTRAQVVIRRVAALLFVGVFLLDVLAEPSLVAAVSRLCGL